MILSLMGLWAVCFKSAHPIDCDSTSTALCTLAGYFDHTFPREGCDANQWGSDACHFNNPRTRGGATHHLLDVIKQTAVSNPTPMKVHCVKRIIIGLSWFNHPLKTTLAIFVVNHGRLHRFQIHTREGATRKLSEWMRYTQV